MKNLRTALLATAIMLNEQIRSRATKHVNHCKSSRRPMQLATFCGLKYNRCVTAKDAVTEAYQLIYEEVNNEKP